MTAIAAVCHEMQYAQPVNRRRKANRHYNNQGASQFSGRQCSQQWESHE
jgi:hypothetical protein